MVRDAPAALARARLARTRTTHSPTPYLTSGERSYERNLPTTTVTIVTLVTTDCTRNHRSLIQPADHLQKPRETSTPSTRRTVRPSNKSGAKNPTLEIAVTLLNARPSCRRPRPPQTPPPSPRADNTGRIAGNISASRGTWLAPAIAPRKPHALRYLSRPCCLSSNCCSQCCALPPAPGC